MRSVAMASGMSSTVGSGWLRIKRIRVVVPEDEDVELVLRDEVADMKALYPYLTERVPPDGWPVGVEIDRDGVVWLVFHTPLRWWETHEE